MPHGRVEAKGTSRSNKPTVTIGGQVYSASQCNPPTTNLQVGDEIDFESASSVYNGATVWFLNAYKVTSIAPLTTPAYPTGGAGIAAPTPTAQAPVGNMTEAERTFASVVVKGAFEAGLIKDKADLGIWTAHARDVLRNT